jgi:hypothetical protein
MGQLRAIGTGALEPGRNHWRWRSGSNWPSALGTLDSAVDGLRRNIAKTSHYNPGLQSVLDAAG